MEQLRNMHRKKGFTLVEVIVVLVVLAILAAIMIPSMVKWIDEARKGQAITEARHCLVAAEGIAVQLYAENKVYQLSANREATMALAEVPSSGTIQSITFDKAMPTHMLYKASNGLYVTYANGVYTVSETGGFDFSDKVSIDNLVSTINTALNNQHDNTWYTPNNNGPKIDALKKALGDAGIDLDSSVSSWALRYDAGYPKLYWTTQDISRLPAGTKIPVMTYTLSSGNYNVWYATVGDKNGVMSITGEVNNTQVTSKNPKDQTYDNMIKKYEEELKNPTH